MHFSIVLEKTPDFRRAFQFHPLICQRCTSGVRREVPLCITATFVYHFGSGYFCSAEIDIFLSYMVHTMSCCTLFVFTIYRGRTIRDPKHRCTFPHHGFEQKEIIYNIINTKFLNFFQSNNFIS